MKWISIALIAIVLGTIAFYSYQFGVLEEDFFLSKRAIAPSVLGEGVSELRLGVPVIPGAMLLKKQSKNSSRRILLSYRVSQDMETVVNFYEKRLRCIATKSRGTTGRQYVLAKELAQGWRSTVIIDDYMRRGRASATRLRIIHCKIR